MRRPALVLLLLFAAPMGPAAAAPATDRGPCHETPFEMASHKIWVPVRVNGSAPQWFIFDTGDQGTSVVARECAARIGLPLGESHTVSLGAGTGAQVHLATARDVALEVAGETFRVPTAAVFELGHVAPFEGRRVDGLLGEDFLHHHVVEIDYARRVLRIYDPETYRYTGTAPPVPMVAPSGLVVVRARVTARGRAPLAARVAIDTGVRTTLIWYRPFVAAHDLVAALPRTFAATIGGGAGGESRGDVGRLARLDLAGQAIDAPTAVFSRDTSGVFAGSGQDGIVGGELLERFRVTFDYPHQRVMLEPYAVPVTGFDYDMSGLFLVARGEAFERVTVLSVAPGSPAAAAGIARDDEITALDGRPANSLTLDALRARLVVRGARVALTVRHAGVERTVTLDLEPLV